jgi:hypothetical protein
VGNEQMEVENKEENFQNPISSTSIDQLLTNIKTFIDALNSNPRVQNFIAARLTNGLSRQEAASISGLSVWKIDRGRQLNKTLNPSQLMLKVTSILESICKPKC